MLVILRPILLGPQPLPDDLQRDQDDGNRAIRRFTARMSTTDYGGQLLFLFGMALIILALTWGGARYVHTSMSREIFTNDTLTR